MAATPETKAKHQIQALLKRYEAQGVKMKLTWNAGASYGSATVDCTGVISGIAVAFEVKRFDGKGKLTARQLADLREYREAGAVAMVLAAESSLQLLENFLISRLHFPLSSVYFDWSNFE